MNSSTVQLFKVVVADKGALDLSNASRGFITDFAPSAEQQKMLRAVFKPLPIVSLFSVTERKTASVEQLLTKQILHYIEVYGLDAPGLFNLEVKKGKIFTVAYIKAVTLAELTEKVNDLLYSNRPIADIKPVVEVIRDYKIAYDINKVANNELKVALYDVKADPFRSGDDAVRYMCYHATDKALLIKSKAVIAAVKAKPVDVAFLDKHVLPLAQVFNRHRRIIMACKRPATASVINKISRLSKSKHVPIHESVQKRFIAEALKKQIDLGVLSGISVRDKLKYLNLIEYRLLGHTYDAFTIRNGKIWVENERTLYPSSSLNRVKAAVLKSLRADLAPLAGKKILLDSSVEYGLPISRKQTLGNLPFGTRVRAIDRGGELSAGVYWHNDWSPEGGSVDLDLTAIDEHGSRTGWGQLSGYANKGNAIVFSGDMTDATDGATEFMVVNPTVRNRYGLMVNIFRGPETMDAEIVVGYPSKKVWQKDTLIRERITLQSKQSIIGFLKDDTFVVYAGRLSNSRVTQGKHPVIDKGLGVMWTINDLFLTLDIPFDTSATPGVSYDYDLRYAGFSLDKLEALFSGDK